METVWYLYMHHGEHKEPGIKVIEASPKITMSASGWIKKATRRQLRKLRRPESLVGEPYLKRLNLPGTLPKMVYRLFK